MKCFFLKILVASMLLNLLMMPINPSISVLIGYVCLLTTVALPIELMLYSENGNNKMQILIIFALISIILLNPMQLSTKLQSQDLVNIIKAVASFFSFLLVLSVKGISYTEKDLKFYFTIIRCFAIVMILYTVIPFDFQYVVINDYGRTQFTLSMGNPNATATKVLFAIIVLGIETLIVKKTFLRWCNVFLITGLMYTLIMLQSRTALLCAVIYIAYALLLKFRVKKWMVTWVWIIPLAFIPIQLMLTKLPELEFLDKTLTTGRETLYIDLLELISSSPVRFVLGNFWENQLSNNHNIILSMTLNFGLLGLVMYMWFWRIEISEIKEVTTKVAQYAWVGWIVFVIHSMAESAVMSGTFTFGSILILLNRMTKDELITPDGANIAYKYALDDTMAKEGERNELFTTNGI